LAFPKSCNCTTHHTITGYDRQAAASLLDTDIQIK